MARRQKIREQMSDFFDSIRREKIDWEESNPIGKKWEELSETERRVISAMVTGFNWLINSLKFLFCYLWQRKLLSFVFCLLLIFSIVPSSIYTNRRWKIIQNVRKIMLTTTIISV